MRFAAAMELAEHQPHNCRVLKIAGRSARTSADRFRHRPTPWRNDGKSGAVPHMLDFAGVDYISSVGLVC